MLKWARKTAAAWLRRWNCQHEALPAVRDASTHWGPLADEYLTVREVVRCARCGGLLSLREVRPTKEEIRTFHSKFWD
jgi:hypothetical protein